ncbi:lipid-A-disaccharide synthase [Methylomagnum ishizawai]|uniref:Lipid-A-disaccharide synthase n=1 Tax=Methylomagnum ishizawai TaxID=1760988 RepID=A0A1Y6D542_9GAMM|nr:lipid-A-disaccharide synthase [Methylomagnum ishizawai]SMF95983.1 lipid-A-disaccharide synthase [Methylomagnum ishizawai]
MAEHAPLVLLSAGEASGDRHAADLFTALKALVPGVRGIGMGGAAMREAGVEIRCDSSGIGVIGLVEIAKHYGEIRRALTLMQAIARAEKPDLLICVDYKEFNFRLAKAAKACGVRVLFYVSPQVWAWRPGRVKTYGRIVDHMAVIFPFEVPFYAAHQIPVTYVGHPLAGKVKPTLDLPAAREKYGLDGAAPVIGLLPGSRANEIKRLFPVILESARRLAQDFAGARFLLFQAPSVADADIQGRLEASGLAVQTIQGQDYDALQCCDAVITVSGTATLEVALIGVPMVIVYRLSPLSYWLGRLLVSIPYIGLPNILAGRGIVREFIQHEANPGNIAAEIGKILREPDYAAGIRQALAEVRERLGDRNGSQELARLAAEMLVPGAVP